ncbi:SDR family NAD(P)-dependent oxidoreductase [Scopulibacillus cellulosilyticus]|uniref:SDR family NAD(P)-dependent oxidoreductase n=1 Tax=Scopulibacillus cellulosilyticus TaxID=2665665 RepID=A0ABW2PWE9_9BACL
MKYTLVTGGAGFIGSHLVKRLLEDGEKVVILDNLSMGKLSNIPLENKNVIFVNGDVSDRKTVNELFGKYNFDKIFHLAAVASVAASIKDPEKTHQTNFNGTIYLLEEAKKQKDLRRFVFASSAAVYGNSLELPKKENSEISPLTPYAIDKYASERYVLTYNSLYKLPTSAVRFFNVYGSGQNPNSPYSGVISILTDRLKANKMGNYNPFILYGDGKQTRDFIFVDDVISALLLVSESNESLGRVFNVGTGKQISLNEMISIYEEISGVNLPIINHKFRDGDIRESYADISLLNNIGFKPKYKLNEGLLNYWNDEIRNLKQQHDIKEPISI